MGVSSVRSHDSTERKCEKDTMARYVLSHDNPTRTVGVHLLPCGREKCIERKNTRLSAPIQQID